jgi:hypothetical protein
VMDVLLLQRGERSSPWAHYLDSYPCGSWTGGCRVAPGLGGRIGSYCTLCV